MLQAPSKEGGEAVGWPQSLPARGLSVTQPVTGREERCLGVEFSLGKGTKGLFPQRVNGSFHCLCFPLPESAIKYLIVN